MPKKEPQTKKEVVEFPPEDSIELVKRLIVSPLVRMLVQAVPVVGPATDIAIATAYDEIARRRTHVFFEELSEGNTTLTEADLSNREFLHAWMCTFNYAIRERREDKIRLFADLFRNYCQNRCFDADSDIYEEHMKILQDLSYREFQILSILARFEHDYADSRDDFWSKFFDSLQDELTIQREEIPAMLQRLTRTGLYETKRGFLTPDDGMERGGLTPNFYSFLAAIKVNVDDL